MDLETFLVSLYVRKTIGGEPTVRRLHVSPADLHGPQTPRCWLSPGWESSYPRES